LKTLKNIKAGVVRTLSLVALLLAWALSFLFYVLVVGPYAVVLRAALGDLLEQEPDASQESYWHRLDPRRPRPDKPF
jgi:hypothetical protein